MISESDIKNSNGVRLLSGLFVETNRQNREDAPYTLRDKDYTWRGKTFVSMYRLYMELMDPTEYLFATTHLADWQHWQMLSEATWFKPYVSRWRQELELKIKAESLARLLQESKSPGREGLSAAKYVLEKGWEPKDTGGKGRPSKQDIKDAANKIASDSKLVNEHFEKLGLGEIHAGHRLK